MSIIEDLKWRHACKRMNGQKVPQEKIDTILEAINLTPTSLGLQAYKVFVIENTQLKAEIYDKACQQLPIKECSHLLVFAAYTQITEKDLDDFFALIERKRNPGKEWCDKYRERINGFLSGSYKFLESWLIHQVYIPLGVACTVAANERVDSLPIEGFDKTELNKILNLTEQSLTSVVLLPLGYKDEANDWLNNVAKVRKDAKDLFVVMK